MKRLTILTAAFLAGCQTSPLYPITEPIPSEVHERTGQSQIAPQDAHKEPKIYGNWSPDLSRFYCLTGKLNIQYVDELGYVKYGVFDDLARAYKFYEDDRVKLVSTSKETIGSSTVYSMKFLLNGFLRIEQRLVEGDFDPELFAGFDADLLNDGYTRYRGEITIGDTKSESKCWAARTIVVLRELHDGTDEYEEMLRELEEIDRQSQ